ncbi:unnamed protein product [Enterobius vermicularis]|uniref:Uncharacterized protein n=1 Tax=Enterobius vermicularis TaxID=51028 RepID=A0A0N4V6Y2_ENTVE|nr:unnamed protein product [Enterobius vermicularis]
MDNERRTYTPVAEKRRFWHSRFWLNTKYYSRRLTSTNSGRALLALALYIGSYNIVMRCVMGSEHPINRFTWRRMEARGELTEELLAKRENLNQYYASKARFE